MKAHARLSSLLAAVVGTFAVGGAEPQRQSSLEHEQRLREVALNQLLTDIRGLCRKMLEQQTAVWRETVALHKTAKSGANQKPRPDVTKAARHLADRQKAIVAEASTAIQLLEGSAVAFPEVFKELHKAMRTVQARLTNCDAGNTTQLIEEDVIETLKEMIRALG